MEENADEPTEVEENPIENETLAGEALRNYRQTIKPNENLVNERSKESSSQPQVLRNLQISEGRIFENRRLRQLNMIRSLTQDDTPGVGNCFIEALADQTRYVILYILYPLLYILYSISYIFLSYIF